MKKTILKIFLFFLFLTILFLKPNIVRAQDLEVTCDGSGSCTLSSPNPLFSTSQDGLWYPGKSIAKTLRIRNNHPTDTTTVSTKAQNPQSDNSSCELDKQLFLSIVEVSASTTRWAGGLDDFYQEILVPLAVFSPGSFDDFIFTVTLPSSVGDECQDKTTSFDLLLNFSGETITPISTPTPTPTSTPAPAATPTPTPTVLGAGVSAPVCTDTKPGSAPTLLSATATGPNEVTLIWSEATDPVTYYLVAFGLSSGQLQFGNPNIGGRGTTSYKVSGLSGGTTYYFKVRAGNGCMPGDYSNEIATTPFGLALPTVVPAGFAPGVLGVEEEEGELGAGVAAVEGEVAGAIAPVCFWWWVVLLLEVLVLSGFYFLLAKSKKEKRFWWSVAPATAFLAWLGDRIAHQWYTPSRFCPWTWLGAIMILAVLVYLFRKRSS